MRGRTLTLAIALLLPAISHADDETDSDGSGATQPADGSDEATKPADADAAKPADDSAEPPKPAEDSDAADAPKPADDSDAVEAPKPKKKKRHHHKKKAAPEEETTTADSAAEVHAVSHGPVAEHDEMPARMTLAAELLGATPLDRGNRSLFGVGGGAALGADILISPRLSAHAGATFVYLSKDAGMSSTSWIAGQIGPRVHVGDIVFGEDTHHDAWVDAHFTYGSSGGIRRPGFDVGGALAWEVSPAMRLGPMLRYQFGSDPRDKNAQLFTVGVAIGYGGRGRMPTHVRGDIDGDGIVDVDDNCPDEPAGDKPDPMRDGCPTGDQDSDGIADEKDVCPEEAAGATPDPSRKGCPFVDTDGDKIADADDKCPTIPGPPNPFDPAKHGCAELARIEGNKIEILQQIFFETDSATIKDESIPVLEAVAAIMKKLDGVRVRVEGHTDDKGTDEYNLDLSKRRARSVAQWLVVSGGIDASRLETEGYGKSRPIVSGENSDPGLNRRVEFVILDSQ